MATQAANAPVACRKHRCMCHEPFNINTQPLFCLVFTIWPQPNREEAQQSPLHSHRYCPQSDTTARSTHKQSEKCSKHCFSHTLIIYMWLQQQSDQRCSTNQFSLQSTAAVPVLLFSSDAAKLSQSINAIDQTVNPLTDPISCKWKCESKPTLWTFRSCLHFAEFLICCLFVCLSSLFTASYISSVWLNAQRAEAAP